MPNLSTRHIEVLLPSAVGEYTDSATVSFALAPSVAEVFEGVDSSIVLEDLVSSGTDEYTRPAIEDSATVVLKFSFTGGECFSTASGLYLEGEAYPRWNPVDNVDRWSEIESARWLAGEPELLHPIEVSNECTRWIVVGEGDVRLSEVENCRWNVESVLPARLCD